MPVSDVAASTAKISATHKANGDIRDMRKARNEKETEALLRRRKRAARSDDQIERKQIRSNTAKAQMQARNGD